MESEAPPRPTRAVTLQDIARHVGVDKTLVSKVLRGNTRHASAATVERIRTAADELGYDPTVHHAARRMAMQRHGGDVGGHAITVFFPHGFTAFRYYNIVFASFIEAFSRADYVVVTDFFDTPIRPFPPLLRRGDIDGAIVLGFPAGMPGLCQKLRNERFFGARPIVALIEEVTDCSCFLADDRQGGYLAAKHLLDIGHRHLIHFSQPYRSHTLRREGYAQALREHGLDEASLRYSEIYEDPAYIEDLVLKLLVQHPEITAYLMPNDVLATKVYWTLARHGVRVPEDISLIGYDDTEIIPEQHGDNTLTTIHVPLAEIGRQAAEHLIARISGAAADNITQVFPTSLLLRGTTAPPQISS